MKHQWFAATLGLSVLALFGLSAQASAATPVGYWLKEDGAAKLQISSCGNNQLCSKIVWLRDPTNSRGEPLHDARNENPALRGRTIIGLPIFQGLVPDSRNSWKGQIYNPEDGGTYKATLTLVSSNQILLKGCLAMFLCGQKTWTRTTFNPEPETPAEPEQLEVKNEEPATPAVEPAVNRAPAAEPKAIEAKTIEASAGGVPTFTTKTHSANADVLRPSLPPSHKDATAGYGFVLTTASPDSPPQVMEGDPSNMYLVSTKPMVQPVAYQQVVAPAPRQAAPKPAPRPVMASAAGSPMDPVSTQSIPRTATADSVPMPDQRPAQMDAYAQAYAEAQALLQQDHLSWRDRRRLKRIRREAPWLLQPQPQQAATSQTITSVAQQ
ncbi:DUF2147 domain-containing protein [Methyloligella sp. 2.7D]|uniref:DUF2147 domain-containing protein n=1 Tax=unclassified Methyloligella TaxID=2625955 RepID=UPI00157BBE44|nr:DUF2147 domain-containing protein [Methyloligella sp. GL2]QKP77832.1 DUF2147 domain-containing protein [Methyloligella sp. GL2]